MEVGVDEKVELVDGVGRVAVEPAALRTGVDRHLEVLASTERFEQINHHGPALAAYDRGCPLGDLDAHDITNPRRWSVIPSDPLAETEHMFDTGSMAAAEYATGFLRLVADRAKPLALARERTLPLLPAIADLFPDGALRRGSVVGTDGVGATSLALAVAAGPSAAGSWTAVVGDAGLGLGAAVEAGVALERLLVVEPPEPSAWAGVVAALVGAVDVVLVAPRYQVKSSDARRLASRLRERGSVLIYISGTGSSGTGSSSTGSSGIDVALRVESVEWSGLGAGHGLLRSRRVVVRAEGRGASSRPRTAELLLPGPTGAPVRG